MTYVNETEKKMTKAFVRSGLKLWKLLL